MIPTKKIIVSGKVQGVGFRWSTYRIATEIGIVGFVKNELNGTVLINAQGTKKQINTFINQIKKSPTPYANITNITIQEIKANCFNNFIISE